MSLVTSLDYIITIDKLLDDDAYAVISSENNNNIIEESNGSDDLGAYLNWRSFELANSIIQPEQAKGNVKLITSNYYNVILSSQDSNNEENQNIIDQVYNFLSTLEGRKITVTAKYELLDIREDLGEFGSITTFVEKVIYVGYISVSPESASARGGATFNIICLPLIAQLDVLSPNVSWTDTTETYGGATPSTVANSWNKQNFEKLIFNNTLLTGTKLEYVTTPDYLGLPDTDIWAFVIPSENRLPTIKQILCPYSLVFYQKADGSLVITPLLYDDKADSRFFINVEDNSQTKNWIDFKAANSSITIPNRVDATLVTLPGNFFGISQEDSMRDILASAPYIQDDQISDLPDQKLKYTEIYLTSTRLYNSGKFIMPQIRNVPIDNALTDSDSIFANLLIARTKLNTSSVNSSADNSNNYIAQLYAQIYLAELNVNAYNAIVVYDYLAVIDAEDPLGKIVNIANSKKLDYPDNIVTDTIITCDSSTGSSFIIKTAPLLSITGCWFSKGNRNV